MDINVKFAFIIDCIHKSMYKYVLFRHKCPELFDISLRVA